MKISSMLLGIKGFDQPVDKASEKKGAAQNTKSGEVKDKVSLSEQGKLLQQSKKLASESPDVRQQKIEIFRAQIADGSYTPDSKKIAQKILEQDLNLLI